MSKLASAAKAQSFCRAGLMGIAQCMASAASGVRRHYKDNEAECNDLASVVEMEFDSESSQNEKILLLDALRFTVESSKQHFNPNYRLRGSFL